ncbi:tyrosine-type recombinase/integrase [Actinomadura geliboluensis]|uniref:tyrosine-type recombinase/integrase n=1 Tax=Actinomadura geliboluensis TaxID=882440 RepID=UPI0014861B14|nr:tyrosine-type recombinase/integrase [Actinomadura geliboluensis]
MAVKQRVVTREGLTWTVLGADYRVVGPIEQYLEFLRIGEHSPNTIASYAKSLELWWTFLERRGQRWDAVGITDLSEFVGQVRRGEVGSEVVSLSGMPAVGDSTVAARVRPVMSFYRHQAARGVKVAATFYETVYGPTGSSTSFLEHIARQHGRRRSQVRLRVRRKPFTVLLPTQMAALREAEARWDAAAGQWQGELRYLLLWTLLEETGLRLGEALALQHRDWSPGTGGTAVIRVMERYDHPHGLRPKSGYRRVVIGSRLDRLYGDWVWALCEAGADVALHDWDSAYIFCNLHRGERFGPLRPSSVYKHLAALKKRVPSLPAAMTPHWYRHTHATALLLAGVPEHVVSRRLGHADIQTTIDTYAHVTEDAELRACADWEKIRKGWNV